jgi:CII-binding regulator of phage lambda lysogenization HflD
MATQEERLQNVEFDLKQFKTETVRVYQDMAFEMTMVKGLTEDAIKRLATLNSTIEKRFDTTNEQLNAIGQRLSQLETQFNEHTTLLTEILARLPKNP